MGFGTSCLFFTFCVLGYNVVIVRVIMGARYMYTHIFGMD